ncbi:MAG: ABC transporter permease [Chlamydiales bacterium]
MADEVYKKIFSNQSISSLFQPIEQNISSHQDVLPPSIGFWQDVWYRFKMNRIAILGLLTLILLIGFAIFTPLMSSHPYYETNLLLKNHPPCKTFWFGTDDLGRDVFNRTAYGARISLFVGIAAAFIDLIIGVLWGGFAALLGGKIDNILMRIADVFYAIPYILVVIMLMVVLGSGLIPILIALTITGWIGMSRIVRGQLYQLKEQEFIQAATALGASYPRILFRHLIPNAMGPIIVTMTLTIPIAIFTEAFLSFLGIGIQAPIPSWGTMASDGLPAMRYYPWRLFFPAFFISITMLAFNLIGDGLRDALDPKLRK